MVEICSSNEISVGEKMIKQSGNLLAGLFARIFLFFLPSQCLPSTPAVLRILIEKLCNFSTGSQALFLQQICEVKELESAAASLECGRNRKALTKLGIYCHLLTGT